MNIVKTVSLVIMSLLSALCCSAVYCGISCGPDNGDIFAAILKDDIDSLKVFIAENPEIINWRGEKGETLLHLAALRGCPDIVQELIIAGVNVTQKDYHGRTPLYWATAHCGALTEKGYIAIAQALIDNGANINEQDDYGNTPLHNAVQCGVDLVATLIAEGAELEAQNREGLTPQQLAQSYGRKNMAILLKDYQLRIHEAQKRDHGHVIAGTLAMATHDRISAESPLFTLPQELLQYISQLTIDAEYIDARHPRAPGQQPMQEEASWWGCVVC